MTLGLSLAAFTHLHVVISVLAIVAGLVVLVGLLQSRLLELWTEVFLVSTVLTSVTGFMFPFAHILPSHIVGGISLVALAAAILALYQYRLAGAWRTVYVVAALLSLYLNVFVLVVQLFQKVPALQKLAPTQSEAPFLLAQIALLAASVWLGYRAVLLFKATPRPA